MVAPGLGLRPLGPARRSLYAEYIFETPNDTGVFAFRPHARLPLDRNPSGF